MNSTIIPWIVGKYSNLISHSLGFIGRSTVEGLEGFQCNIEIFLI